jgi:hypothetical protein
MFGELPNVRVILGDQPHNILSLKLSLGSIKLSVQCKTKALSIYNVNKSLKKTGAEVQTFQLTAAAASVIA